MWDGGPPTEDDHIPRRSENCRVEVSDGKGERRKERGERVLIAVLIEGLMGCVDGTVW